MAETEIIAHRGASYDAPENTLASIALAWKQDADAAEIDIHLSSDNHIIVMHDKNTKRTTGIEGEIASLKLAELKTLDAGAWKDSRFAGAKIPTLDEVLSTQPHGKRLVIELKAGEEVVGPLKKCLEQSRIRSEQVIIIGFNYEVIKAAKKALHEITALWLRSDLLKDQDDQDYSNLLDESIQSCREANIDGLNLHFNWFADTKLISRGQQAGVKIYSWTINDAEVAFRLAQAGIDGITTDRPGWIRGQIEERL